MDYTSRVDKRHEKIASLFKNIPPREYDAGYFMFVDSFSSQSRAAIKVHLLQAAHDLRIKENWPKRINGNLYVENMVDFAMAEVMHPAIRTITDWHRSIADIPLAEWRKGPAWRYEGLYSTLLDWAWEADHKVWQNASRLGIPHPDLLEV